MYSIPDNYSDGRCDATIPADHPDSDLDALWQSLEDAPEERELFIRQRIWWKYNVKKFESIDDIDDWHQNCLDMLDLLDVKNPDHRIMAAELNRNLCNYAGCMKLLGDIPDTHRAIGDILAEECKRRNPLTVKLSEKRKRIYTENTYDILQNAAKDMLFCISEREGEPDNPQIVYAGGKHALLYRSPDVVVVLDYVHEEAREQLTKTENVLIAEFVPHGSNRDMTGIVREYTANVRIENQLPDEPGLEHFLPAETDDISVRFAEKIDTDEDVARNAMEYYRSLAEKCNAAAQYELGKLYRDDRFFDLDEAVRWLYYAAFQGHREAFDELEDINQADDDGSHDAWS